MKKESPKVTFTKRDRKVVIKNGKIFYTKNQKGILDAALKGLMPSTSKEFKLLNDILKGEFKLKYPAKNAGAELGIADDDTIIKLTDNPLLRLMDAFYTLFGKDFGSIYSMVIISKPREREKALRMAERMIIHSIEDEKKQARCKHKKWLPFKKNPKRFVECANCGLIKEKHQTH